MKTHTEIDFDFKKIKDHHIQLGKEDEENLLEVFFKIFVRNFSLTSSYIIMAILVFHITNIDLIPFVFILTKLGVTISAIVQALKYINKKSLKMQIANGFIHTGILLCLFKYDGFLSLTSFFKQTLSGFFI